MRSTTFFHTALNFLTACFFVLAGLLALVLPWIAGLRRTVVDILVANPVTMTFLGIGFATVGAVLLISICGKQRQYYHLKSGNQAVTVAETLLDDYLNDYWEEHFPEKEFVSHVTVNNNVINITADLPALPFDEQRPFLKKAEHQIAKLLSENVGYHEPFSMSISFHEASDAISLN